MPSTPHRLHLSPLVLVFLLTVFGSIHSLDFAIAGLSNTLLRDLFVLVLAIIASLTIKQPRHSGAKQLLLAANISLFTAFGFSLLGESHLAAVAPHAVRVTTFLLVATAYADQELSVESRSSAYRWFYGALQLYCAASLMLYAFPLGRSATGSLEGLGGQHFSKFLFVISTIFFSINLFSKWSFRKSVTTNDLVSLGLSIACLFLVLQRGAYLALLVGIFAMTPLIFRGLNTASRLLLPAIAALLAVYAFNSDYLLTYSFFPEFGPSRIFNAIVDGTFTPEMVRARGRLQMAEVLLASASIDFIGNGPGYAKAIIGSAYFDGREPHNDVLMLLIDLGIFGLGSFALCILALLAIAVWRHRNAIAHRDFHAHVLLVTGAASLLGFAAWMLVSNVLVYASYNFLLSTIFIVAGARRVRSIPRRVPPDQRAADRKR